VHQSLQEPYPIFAPQKLNSRGVIRNLILVRTIAIQIQSVLKQGGSRKYNLICFYFDVCVVLPGRCGQSISMVTEFDIKLLKAIENHIRES